MIAEVAFWIASFRTLMAIGAETLNVEGMKGNRSIAKAISDAAISEFLRVFRYKAGWAVIPFFRAGLFYASSKTCSGSRCGAVKEDLTLKDRIYRCSACGRLSRRVSRVQIPPGPLMFGAAPELESRGGL
jgi:putative transposase